MQTLLWIVPISEKPLWCTTSYERRGPAKQSQWRDKSIERNVLEQKLRIKIIVAFRDYFTPHSVMTHCSGETMILIVKLVSCAQISVRINESTLYNKNLEEWGKTHRPHAACSISRQCTTEQRFLFQDREAYLWRLLECLLFIKWGHRNAMEQRHSQKWLGNMGAIIVVALLLPQTFKSRHVNWLLHIEVWQCQSGMF